MVRPRYNFKRPNVLAVCGIMHVGRVHLRIASYKGYMIGFHLDNTVQMHRPSLYGGIVCCTVLHRTVM